MCDFIGLTVLEAEKIAKEKGINIQIEYYYDKKAINKDADLCIRQKLNEENKVILTFTSFLLKK